MTSPVYPLPARTLADDPVEHLADSTAQTEFYNMMMAHMDGTRATPFFVNVQHPEFGATGRDNNALDESGELNEASLFASRDGGGIRRGLWLPATNVDGARARYYVDSPFKVYTGMTVWGEGARIAASPRFDFVTKFFTENTGWNDIEQGIVEGYNVTPENPIGRIKMGRFNLRGLLIEGMDIPGSIGAIFQMQQQSLWQSVRINNFTRIGMILSGQQGCFQDFMVTGSNPDFGPSATYPIIGVHLGMPDYVASHSASFFWFYQSNIESCYRGVFQNRGAGANVFRDTHFEGVDSTNSGDPAYCFYLSRGQIVVDQAAWFLAPTDNYGTFLHSQKAAGAEFPAYNISDVFISSGGPPTGDNALFLNDVDRGHVLNAWGDTRASVGESGVVRHVNSVIGASMADGTWPRPHILSIVHDEGGYTAFGTYNRVTVDAEQLPILRMRPGATQMGHLTSWYDKTGVERFLVTADGVPKLPGYTAATRPSAVGRRGVLIYFLDTDKVQVSNNTTWLDMY